MHWRPVAFALAAFAILAPAARADDKAVLSVASTLLPPASSAAFAAAGGSGGATAVQAQYDAARDIQEALARAQPASPACEPLAVTLEHYAGALVIQAEGVDRQRPAQASRAGGAAADALEGYGSARSACLARPGRGTPAAVAPRIEDPGSFEAFFGAVRARAPSTAAAATVTLDGKTVARGGVHAGWLRLRISGAPAHGRLVVTFLSAGGVSVGRAISREVWLLPRSASVSTSRFTDDPHVDAALSQAAAGFSGISAVYTADLRTGAEASWNAEASFPAASTVKLGVLAAALIRLGPRPEETSAFYDLQALAAWSSNLAANRLLTKISGSPKLGAAAAQAELRRLGAKSSTYPGNYIVGTAFVAREPPHLSSRVTTARDLGTALLTLQLAAVGQSRARRISGLSVHEARVALGLLLRSQPAGDNLGLIRGTLGPTLPIVQKQGWLDDVRITAAIVYTTSGPRLVAICAYQSNLALSTAMNLGQRVLASLRIR
jgi:hypothetical protein